MKRIFFLLGLVLSLTVSGQRVYTDSIDFALIVASDTVIYPNLGRWGAMQDISIEFDYTDLDTSTAVILIGFSNTGRTFNVLDSVICDTATQSVNGHHSTVTGVATAQATTFFTAVEGLRTKCKYPCIKFKKNSVTSGKIYYYIMKP